MDKTAERTAEIERITLETKIKIKINLDGNGINNIDTGIGFFDHMLTHISRHGFIDMNIKAHGDLDVDFHHTVEDVGIVLGKCISKALGKKEEIKRYGYWILPMDEALVLCSLDLSGRSLLCFDVNYNTEKIGDFDVELIEEFFKSLCHNCGLNLHLKLISGKNSHHIAEALFKAFGKALDMAIQYDSRINGTLSTKGMLEI